MFEYPTTDRLWKLCRLEAKGGDSNCKHFISIGSTSIRRLLMLSRLEAEEGDMSQEKRIHAFELRLKALGGDEGFGEVQCARTRPCTSRKWECPIFHRLQFFVQSCCWNCKVGVQDIVSRSECRRGALAIPVLLGERVGDNRAKIDIMMSSCRLITQPCAHDSQQFSICYSNMVYGVFYDCYVSLNLNSQLNTIIYILMNVFIFE